jgi:hypothetical protein
LLHASVWLPVLISTIKKTVRAMSPPCGPPVLPSGTTGVSTRRQVGPPSSAQAPSPRVRPPTAVRAPPSISARHEARERRERERRRRRHPSIRLTMAAGEELRRHATAPRIRPDMADYTCEIRLQCQGLPSEELSFIGA